MERKQDKNNCFNGVFIEKSIDIVGDTLTATAASLETIAFSVQRPFPVTNTVSFRAKLVELPPSAVTVPTAEVPAIPVDTFLSDNPFIYKKRL